MIQKLKKFTNIEEVRESGYAARIVPVLANLAIQTNQRKKGYAQQLIQKCEDFMKVLC